MANPYLTKVHSNHREEWLKERMKGLGSSDIAIVMGLVGWKSPLALWLEKTGEVEPDDLSDNEAVHWGNVLEAVVAMEYKRRTGNKIRKWGALLQSKEHPWAQCTPDYMTWIDGEMCLLEIKTASAYRTADWDEGTPLAYLYQIQHQMLVTGLQVAHSAVLIGGQKFAYDVIPRDEQIIRKIIYGGGRFWERVMAGEQPEANEKDGALLNRMYDNPAEESTELPPAFLEHAKTYEACRVMCKMKERQKEKLKNIIKQKMGDFKYGHFFDGTVVTGKPFKVKISEERKS